MKQKTAELRGRGDFRAGDHFERTTWKRQANLEGLSFFCYKPSINKRGLGLACEKRRDKPCHRRSGGGTAGKSMKGITPEMVFDKGHFDCVDSVKCVERCLHVVDLISGVWSVVILGGANGVCRTTYRDKHQRKQWKN